MITGLPNPKETFLLGAALDVLHNESQEWLATIEHWKYELRFFSEILYWKKPKKKDEDLFKSLLKEFEKIKPLINSGLEKEVMDHEKYLADLLRNKQGSNWEYREKHKQIKSFMLETTSIYKAFKKDVFDYVKLL
jgi:hypothetical protein